MTEIYKISFGIQIGTALPLKKAPIKFPAFTYISHSVDRVGWGHYFYGGYYASHTIVGDRNALGLVAAMEYPTTENKFI